MIGYIVHVFINLSDMFRVSFVRRGDFDRQDFGHLESPATQSFNLLMGVAENYMAYEGTEYCPKKLVHDWIQTITRTKFCSLVGSTRV